MATIETTTLRPRRRGRPAPDAAPVADDDALLSAAFEAFAERGYEGTAIRDIARQLQVSHNLIHFRFGSKEALWRRAVDHVFGKSVESVFPAFEGAYADHNAALRSIIVRFCVHCWRHPGSIGIMNLEGRRASWRLDHLYKTYVAPFQSRLDTLLANIAAKTGARRVPTDAFLVLLIHGAGNFFALRPLMELTGSAAVNEAIVRQQAEIFADLLLPALEARDSDAAT